MRQRNYKMENLCSKALKTLIKTSNISMGKRWLEVICGVKLKVTYNHNPNIKSEIIRKRLLGTVT